MAIVVAIDEKAAKNKITPMIRSRQILAVRDGNLKRIWVGCEGSGVMSVMGQAKQETILENGIKSPQSEPEMKRPEAETTSRCISESK